MDKPINRIFFLCSFILCIARPALYAGTDSASYALTRYSNENGLPQNSIKAIAADEYGFIWLATESGLVRFDGRHFSLYNRNNTGIASSRIIDISRAPATGNLYAVTQNWTMLGIARGKVYPEKRKWEVLYRRIGRPTVSSALLPQAWKYEGWVDSYHQDSLQLYLPHDTTILAALNGNLYWYYKEKHIGQTHIPLRGKLHKIFALGPSLYLLPDKASGSYTVSRIGMGRIDTVSLSGDIVHQPRKADWILGLNRAMQQVFIYSDKHLYLVQRLSNGNLHTTLLLSGYDFQKLKIGSCYYDSLHQRIFLGSAVHGLYVFSAKPFATRTCIEAGNNSNVFYDHIAYDDTSILTARGILFNTRHPGYKVFGTLREKSDGLGNTLYKAKDGTLWTADYYYVYQMSPQGTTVLHRWQIRAACAFTQLASGDICVGTNQQGIYTIQPDRPEEPPRCIKVMHDRVVCMEQETADILWLATDNHLFRCSLPDMKLDTITALNGQVVRNIYIPRQQEVWFCTYEAGFYLYHDQQLTKFPPDRYKYLNTVHHIAEDAHGFFWVSTNNGIFKMAKRDLFAYAADHTKIPFYLYYSKESGFNTNEFNGSNQRVGAQLADGTFTFASVDGIIFFNPADFRSELPDAPLIVDGIEVNGSPITISNAIRLRHSFSDIRFRIATAYFGNPDNLMLEYRLDNNEWIHIENESFAFNALPAGRHQLQVRKRAGFHNSYRYCSITFDVLPAFWETWWFRGIALLLIIGAIWLLIRLRILYLNRKNKTLEQTVALRTAELNNIISVLEVSEMKLAEELRLQQRLIGNIAHDIKTPLKYLTLSAKNLSNKVRQQEMPDYAEMEGIYISSTRIYSFTENLMSYLQARLESGVVKKELNLREIIEHQKEIFNIALHTQGNAFLNKIAPELNLRTHRQLLNILLHNLTDNAVKNTENGTITFSATRNRNSISIHIQDSGKGIGLREAGRYNTYFREDNNAEKGVYTGFGFLIIKDILPLIDANLHFESGQGTLVTLTINIPEDQIPGVA